MSQAGGSGSSIPLGTARVDFIGDTTKLDAAAMKAKATVEEVKQAEAGGGGTQPVRAYTLETERFAQESERAQRRSEQFAKTLEEEGETYKRQIGKVRSFFGAFAAVGAIAASMFGLGRAIREGVIAALETGEEKARRFSLALDLSKPRDAIASIDKELETLQSRLAANGENFWGNLTNSLTGQSSSQLREQIDSLQKIRSDASKTARRRDDLEERQEARRRYLEEEEERQRAAQQVRERVMSAYSSAVSGSLEGERKIIYDLETQLLELDKLRLDSGKQYHAQIQAAEDALHESAKRRIEELKSSREREASEREAREKRIIENIRDFNLRALDQIRRAADQFNGTQQAFDTGRIESLLEQLVNKRGET